MEAGLYSKSHTIYGGQNWKMQMPRSVQLKWAPQIRQAALFFPQYGLRPERQNPSVWANLSRPTGWSVVAAETGKTGWYYAPDNQFTTHTESYTCIFFENQRTAASAASKII